MALQKIVTSMLGLAAPWHVSSVALSGDGQRLDITVSYAADDSVACPCCGAREISCAAETETWYHPDFCRYVTYLHSRVPRLSCCGRIQPIDLPWVRTGSKFVKLP